MDVLLANEITPSMIVSNNAPERLSDQVEWDADGPSSNGWPAGSVVTRTSTRRVYRAVYDVPKDADPPEENIANAQLPYWIDKGPMNKWGLFDGQVQTQTVGPEDEDLVIVLKPGPISNVWLGNLSLVNSVQVTLKDKTGGSVVYDQEHDMYEPVTTYWDWWFGPFKFATDVLFTGIPAYRSGELTITIKTGSTASVGMAAIGKTERLGCTLWDPETDFRNYAARQLDQTWGPSEGTGGVVTRDQRYSVIVEPEDAPRVSRFMDKAMRRPAVWIPHGHPKFEGIRGFGQAVGSRMRYPDPSHVNLSLEIRGFI